MIDLINKFKRLSHCKIDKIDQLLFILIFSKKKVEQMWNLTNAGEIKIQEI